jgi:PAS domain S-box-containing protein
MTKVTKNGGKFEPMEVDLRCKDGSTKTVIVSCGSLTGDFKDNHLVLFSDITERKREERARRLFRELIERSNDEIHVVDPKTRMFLDVNQSAVKALGYTREEILSTRLDEIVPEMNRDLFSETGELNGKEKHFQFECIQRRKDGSTYPVDVGVSQVVLDRPYLVAVVRDLSKRQEQERQISLLASALSAADNSIFIADVKGNIQWVNPAFTRLSGYESSEVIGRNPRMFKSGRQTVEFYADLWQTILSGHVWHGELINRRKDGTNYNEDMTVTPVRDAGGVITHFIAIKQDITQRLAMNNRLQQAEKMEAIGTLAGGIAHDFNNILAAMFGFGHLLKEDVSGDSVASENIQEILNAAGRAKDLVQQILTFSRQREQSRRIVHLNTVVKEALKFLRASLPSAIRIEIDLAEDAPPVLADPSQIYQVVLNLATNAFHAMEGQQERLIVTMHGFTSDEAFLRSNPDAKRGYYNQITVADSGCGMDDHTRERIFEPFFTTKPMGKGTGLGLSVVHGIIKSHQGIITVESKPGKGTVFNIFLPAQSEAAPAENSTTINLKQGNGQRILVVDDEPSLTRMFEKLLTRLKYRPTTCSHPAQALELLWREPKTFSLVITDYTMPGMDGLQLSREIQTISPGLPVLLASGLNQSISDTQLETVGIVGRLEKPVTLENIAVTVADVLQTKVAGSN